MWQATIAADLPPGNWELWLEQANAVDGMRNGGTAGTADEAFYAGADPIHGPAPGAGSRSATSCAFRHGIGVMELRGSQRPRPSGCCRSRSGSSRWISADELRDGLVFARLHLRDAAGARQALDTLARFSTRPAGDLRSQLLAAYVRTAEGMSRKWPPLGATARP